jgi:hypothetical protein
LDYPRRAFLLEGIPNGFRVTTSDYEGHHIWENNYKSATDEPRRALVEQHVYHAATVLLLWAECFLSVVTFW